MATARRFRFTMATAMMLVVAAGAGSALFAKVQQMQRGKPFGAWSADIAAILVLATGLTAVAIGAARRHTAVQVMLQATLAFLMFLALFHLGGAAKTSRWALRGALYWFQACFLLTAVLPALAIGLSPPVDPESPRSRWWRGTFEAVFASFATVCLVGVGALLQFLGIELANVLF
jgi:hypothetical protein